MKKILSNWRGFLTESKTSWERLTSDGDRREMFRHEVNQMIQTAYNHKAVDDEYFKLFDRFNGILSSRYRAMFSDDLEKIIKVLKKGQQLKLPAQGWPEFISLFTGRYSYHPEYDYEIPEYETIYLGPPEEPSSVFNGQPVKTANEPFLIPTLNKLKQKLESRIDERERLRFSRRNPWKKSNEKEIGLFYLLGATRKEMSEPIAPPPKPDPSDDRFGRLASMSYDDMLDLTKRGK